MNQRLGTLLLVLMSIGTAAAHPISMSETEIDVHKNKINVLVKIMLEDLTLHYPLKSGADMRYSVKDLLAAAKKHGPFIVKNLHLRNEKGVRLRAKLKKLDSSRIPKEGAAQADLKRFWLTYHIELPLAKPLPFLTVTQTLGGSQTVLPAIMECIVLQKGILLDSQQVLDNQSHSVKFDWKNPIKRATSIKELRRRRAERIKQRLGIASYAGLYSFIYITDREVRHEILVPMLTLERWVAISRRNKDFLTVQEQQRAKKGIGKYFSKRNPVLIDGKKVRGRVSRISFFGLDINDFALNAKPRKVSSYQARVGIILSYPSGKAFQRAHVQWETFDKYAPFMRSVVYVHQERPQSTVFRPDGKGYLWKSKGNRPSPLTIANVKKYSSGQIKDTQAKELTSTLLSNVYRAFDYRKDTDVYDALERSVSGDLLRKIYLQIKRSLVVAEQGGARAHVQRIQVVDGKLVAAKSGYFRYQCSWRVVGTVEHWGHIHTRENQYTAEFTVALKSGSWKLQQYNFRGQKRIRFQTTIRK